MTSLPPTPQPSTLTTPSLPLPPLPPTPLPASPSALLKFLHSSHLLHLQAVYEDKVIQALHQLEEEAKARRSRRAQRQRRRRNSSPEVPTESTSDDDEFAARKKLTYSADLGETIDPAHAYNLLFDLAPSGASDEYYHGPHPPPPPKVVRAVLRASKLPPLFDPEGLSTKQLYGAARAVWEEEGKRSALWIPEGETAKEAARANAEAEEEWESDVIASFSTGCDARIAKSIARLPPSQRPVFTPALLPQTTTNVQGRQHSPAAFEDRSFPDYWGGGGGGGGGHKGFGDR